MLNPDLLSPWMLGLLIAEVHDWNIKDSENSKTRKASCCIVLGFRLANSMTM